ncbi:MAG TPA: acetyltransferase [Candidatus Melainabacteria bacterium]|jgi:sugar O-acyltransferase (sialic acid O-acetyltransferase NeuD family)|nr:acetyltransferase [Candidatus Melainabacteria bacterium]HIN63096.1 acetyltransferase [Candidatus Obscuribacterales bacterium]
MNKVVVFGTGRGADIAHRYLAKDSDYEVCAFTVDAKYLQVSEFKGLPVVDFDLVQQHYSPQEYKLFVPLGSQDLNKVRYKKYLECKEKGYELASYVSSTIPFSDELEIGENCLILENNSINFDVRIGNNVTIWSGNQIGDRSVISDHCWITSHVCMAGDVTIKPFSFIGINASISNGVVIEEENFIGANALITKSTGPKEVYVVSQTPKAAFPSDKFCSMLGKNF